jgi:membrane-bound lytic murein transglycosylase D
VPAFIAAVYVMKCSDKHHISSQRPSYIKITDTIQVNRFISIPTLANALNMDEEELCTLNPSYKKKIVNGTESMPKRVIVPKVSLANFARIYEVLNPETETNMKVVLASNEERRPVRNVKSRPVFFYHKVKPGQNLGEIANKYHVEVQDLKVWNKLRSLTIVPGQKIKVYSTHNNDDTPSRLKS